MFFIETKAEGFVIRELLELVKHVSRHKKVHLSTCCLQTGQGAFTRRAFLKQVLAIITN